MSKSEHHRTRIRASFLITVFVIVCLLIAELFVMYRVKADVDTINLDLVPRILDLKQVNMDLLEIRQQLESLSAGLGQSVISRSDMVVRSISLGFENVRARLEDYEHGNAFDDRLMSRASGVFENLEAYYSRLRALAETDSPATSHHDQVEFAAAELKKRITLALQYVVTLEKLINEEVGFLVAQEDLYLHGLNERFERFGWGILVLSAALVGIAYASSRFTEKTIATHSRMLERKLVERTAALEKSRESLEQVLVQERQSQQKVLEKQTQLHKANQALTQSLAQLKQTQSAMAQQEKLASIGHLAAGVAHEINNPLGFILSNINRMNEYIEDLVDIVETTEKWLRAGEGESLETFRENYLGMLRDKDVAFIIEDLPSLVTDCGDGGERVKEIIRSLKDFSRMDNETDQFSRHNIRVVIEKSLNLLRNEIKYDVDLEFNCPDSVEVDLLPGPVAQVIANIVINAVAAIRKANRRGLLKISVTDRGANVFIRISDNGCGIPPENIDRIFDPFFTTKKVGEGTGLGMNIAYDIIKNRHGGELKVASEVEVGTEFTIVLPKRPYLEVSDMEEVGYA